MNVLPDTSFLVDLLRGQSAAVDLWEELAAEGAVMHMSPVVLFELRFGFLWRADRLQEAQFDALAATMPTADFTDHAATKAAELQVTMSRAGKPLAVADALIAGTAAAGRFVLVTGDQGLVAVQRAGVAVRYHK